MLQNLKEHETQAGYGHICINKKRILTVILTENAKSDCFWELYIAKMAALTLRIERRLKDTSVENSLKSYSHSF